MDIDGFTDWNSNPENSQDSIEQAELRHLQGTARFMGDAMSAMDCGQISSVAKIFDLVVSTGPQCDQGGCVVVVCVVAFGLVDVMHGRYVSAVELWPFTMIPPGIVVAVPGDGLRTR